MKSLRSIFKRDPSASAVDALPNPGLIQQIVAAIITESPDGIFKDKKLPANWTSISYDYRIKETHQDGSFAADAKVLAASGEAPPQEYAVGRQAGLLLAKLYQDMRAANQEWVSCRITITRQTPSGTPDYTADFIRE